MCICQGANTSRRNFAQDLSDDKRSHSLSIFHSEINLSTAEHLYFDFNFKNTVISPLHSLENLKEFIFLLIQLAIDLRESLFDFANSDETRPSVILALMVTLPSIFE